MEAHWSISHHFLAQCQDETLLRNSSPFSFHGFHGEEAWVSRPWWHLPPTSPAWWAVTLEHALMPAMRFLCASAVCRTYRHLHMNIMGKKKNKITSYQVCAKWKISVLFGSVMCCFLLALRHYKITSLEIFMLCSISAHKMSGQIEHSIHTVSSVSLRNPGLISHPLKAKAKFL